MENRSIISILITFIVVLVVTIGFLLGIEYYNQQKDSDKIEEEKNIKIKDKTEEEIEQMLENLTEEEANDVLLLTKEGKALPKNHPFSSFTVNDIVTLTKILNQTTNNARMGAAKSAAYAYADAVALHLMMGTINDENFKIDYDSFTDTTISVKGSKPTKVDLVIKNAVIVGGYIIIDGYTVTFDKNGNATVK